MRNRLAPLAPKGNGFDTKVSDRREGGVFPRSAFPAKCQMGAIGWRTIMRLNGSHLDSTSEWREHQVKEVGEFEILGTPADVTGAESPTALCQARAEAIPRRTRRSNGASAK